MSIAVVTPDDALFDAIFQELSKEDLRATRLTKEDRLGAGSISIVDGLEVARTMRLTNPGSHVIALLSANEIDACDNTFADIAVKPLGLRELRLRVTSLMQRLTEGDVHAHVLAEAVEQGGDITEITNPRAQIQYVNPAFTKILGYRKEEVVGKTVGSVVRSDFHSPEFFKELDATLSAGRTWRGLLMSRARDGSLVHLDTTISPICNAKGEVTHHVSVKRDITESVLREEALRETNRALAQARDAALAASKSKSEFLANMSHELRTPLNAIIGYGELLMEDAQEEGRDELHADLAKIRDAGAHLLDLINDVLDISKVEAGKMELQIEEFDLSEVMKSVASTIKPLAEKKHNVFSLDWHTPPPERPMRADRRKLKQVLMNLLSNACRFTENGEVHLAVSVREEGDRQLAVFAVRDTGIGIDHDQREKIFRPFTQADSSTTRKYGGTGLGLTISKHFCEMMGGSITLESEPGKGSTFTATMPLRAASPRTRQSTLPRSAQRILIIADDPSASEMLERTLEPYGYQLHNVKEGQEGLALAREILPSLIILDVAIPDMNGWSVLSSLKLDPETEHIPVVMLTMRDHGEIGLTLGAVDYFVKPFEPQKLLSTVRRHIHDQESPLTVLVVEDDGPTRELMQRTLEGAGHTVLTAENGRIGLHVLERAPQINLVVLDLMMPEMDGFQFLDRLRTHEKHHSLPVVVATAKTLTVEERHRLQETTQRIVEKNAYSRSELLKIVERHVTRLLSVPPPPPPPAPEPPAS